MVVVILVFLYCRRKRRQEGYISVSDNKTLATIGSSPQSTINSFSLPSRPDQDQAIAFTVNPSHLIEYHQLTLLKRIGSGGFGVVYKAILNGEEVAAKCINSNGTSELQDEINLMSKLQHPNVVNFKGVCIPSPHSLILVMEYMDVGNVRTYLNNQGRYLSWNQRIRMMEDMAQGLKYLHENGVIHRDIKTENFLVNSSFTVKVCDFGISKETDNSFTHTKAKGSYKYFAPELTRSEKIGFSTDVFSLSFVMWEVATGKTLFEDKSVLQLPTLVAQGLRPETHMFTETNSQHKKNFAELLKRCWDNQPKMRPTTPEIITNLQSCYSLYEEL